MANAEVLGQRLEKYRIERNYTQEELARMARISLRDLIRIEEGHVKRPSVFLIDKLAEKLGVDMDTLLR